MEKLVSIHSTGFYIIVLIMAVGLLYFSVRYRRKKKYSNVSVIPVENYEQYEQVDHGALIERMPISIMVLSTKLDSYLIPMLTFINSPAFLPSEELRVNLFFRNDILETNNLLLKIVEEEKQEIKDEIAALQLRYYGIVDEEAAADIVIIYEETGPNSCRARWAQGEKGKETMLASNAYRKDNNIIFGNLNMIYPTKWKPETRKNEAYPNILHTYSLLKESAYLLASKAVLANVA